MITAETGAMMEDGGLASQPDWFVENLAWFLPRYNSIKFYSRAASILGGDDKKVNPRGRNK